MRSASARSSGMSRSVAARKVSMQARLHHAMTVQQRLKSRPDFPLTLSGHTSNVPAPRHQHMKVCAITHARPTRGSIIHRRGLAKKKGGIGQHVTKVVPRTFTPNLQTRRLWVTELKRFVTVKLTA